MDTPEELSESLDGLPALRKNEDEEELENSSFMPKRRTSRIASIGDPTHSNSISRKSSTGTQRLINDFMSAAGVDHAKNNLASVAKKKLDEIAPNFVPNQVRKYCEKLASLDTTALEPTCGDAFACVVMVDVSGYSKLSAALADKGPIGSELLSKAMKGYLDKIIETILSHGGDIVKFAGDAVIFYWKIDNDAPDANKDTTRGEIVLKAAQCCLDLLTRLGTHNIDIEDCATKVLKIHLGIGAGPIYEINVGGDPGRWEFFICGDGVNQLGSVLDLAKAGELAMSHQALKYFSSVIDIDTINIGNYDKRCIILTGVEKARRKVPEPPTVKVTRTDLSPAQQTLNRNLYTNFIDRTALFKIQADINQSQLFGMEIEISALLNLIELRQVTTVFIKIGDLQIAKGSEILSQSQKAIQIVQTALYNNEGTLRQFHVDDKGAVILCFFGLPPMAHENDPGLAVKAALDIRQEFTDEFNEFSIGVTTGVVAFGGVGLSGRTEYAVMGDSINMAARLMCHPDAAENILVDEKTFNICTSSFKFTSLGETKVKGKANPISIFRPESFIKHVVTKDEPHVKKIEAVNIIGRIKEKAAIRTLLGKITNRDQTGILVIEADGGQGLSTLVDFTRTEGIARGCNFCFGIGTEMEKATPYFVFRAILNEIFALIERSVVQPDGTLKIPVKTAPIVKATAEIAPWDEPDAFEKPSSIDTTAPIANTPTSATTTASTKTKMSFMKSFVGFTKRQSDIEIMSPTASMNGSAPSATSVLPAVKALVEVPSHAPIKKKTASDELLADDDKDERVNLAKQEQDQDNNQFSERAKAALSKIGGNSDSSSVLNLVMPVNFSDNDTTAMMSRKVRLKELGALISRLTNALLVNNYLVFVIKESQYLDTLSWELLLEVLSECPRLSLFLFTRRLDDYDSENRKNCVLKIKGMPNTVSITLENLDKEEAKQMMLNLWNGPKIKAIAPAISDTIFKRSDGKPLFIRSLITSLKESGQWRITDDGTLSTQGEINIGFSFDDRNIVLSQFDRLGRSFQLFLKIAAVLGQSFHLQDVLFFLTGMAGILDKIDEKSLSDLIMRVEKIDKYGFIKRESDDLFTFKSVVVRDFVYSLMVLQQRQQLHARVARYLESKMDESNRYQLLIPVYEHYLKSGDNEREKKLFYLEAVSNYHFQHESMHESIKAYNQLLKLTENDRSFDNTILAHWNRELGCAYLFLKDYTKAEKHFNASLQYLDSFIPPFGAKFDSELKKHVAIRQKSDKTLTKGPIKEDYITSYPDYKGSSEKLNQGFSNRSLNNFVNTVPAKETLILSLVYLSEVFLRTGQSKQLKLSVLMGLNYYETIPKDSLYCRLMAENALYTYLYEDNQQLALKYLEVAESFDVRSRITDSIHILTCSAKLSFLLGNWAECKRKYDALRHLGNVAHDSNAIQESLKMKSILFFFGNSRPSSFALAKELYAFSKEQDDWDGQYWGSYLLVSNMLSFPPSETATDLPFLIQTMNALWDQATNEVKASNLHQVCRQGIMSAISMHKGEKVNPASYLVHFADQFEALGPDEWISFIGCLHAYHAMITAFLKDTLMLDNNSKAIVNKIGDIIPKHTKSGIHPCILAADFKRLYKGLKSLVNKSKGDMLKAFTSGIESQGQTDAVYIHGLFNASMAKFHDKKGEAEKYLTAAQTLLSKVGAAHELVKIFNF